MGAEAAEGSWAWGVVRCYVGRDVVGGQFGRHLFAGTLLGTVSCTYPS